MNGLGAFQIVSRHVKQPSDEVKLPNLVRNICIERKSTYPAMRSAVTGKYLIGEEGFTFIRLIQLLTVPDELHR